MKGKATSNDIAYLAGVSQPTVSRALRGSPTVNEETRRRILQIAQELNYKVDKNASSLRSQQCGTIALLFFEDPTLDDSLINPFFLSMLGSLTRACALQGYDLLISFQQLSSNWHMDYQDSKKADGIILLGYGDYLEYRARLEQLIEKGTHFVCWGAVQTGQPGISIGCDNFRGGRDITDHLLQCGRRNIAFVGHASDHYPEFFERYRGYTQALQDSGLPVNAALQIDAFTNEQSGYDAACRLLDQGIRFDGMFCASDLIAIGAMRALQDRGLRTPEDVAVAGFDDIPTARFANPSLTTVHQDTKVAATLLVDSLLASIHGEPVESHSIVPSLVVRRSTSGHD
ncbi:MAG TPA: LacI family DNA-binding transcriptional regulator [Povalibacter sp.]